MKKENHSALQMDCRLYGLYKTGILSLKDIIVSRHSITDPALISQLAKMRRHTERLETFFDTIEIEYGIDNRMILWRYLVNGEDVSHIARDYHTSHNALMRQISRLMQEADSYA